MRMYIDYDSMPITSILDMASLSATSTATSTNTTPLSSIFHTALSLASSNSQELKEELLNDVSFVAQDMPEFLTSIFHTALSLASSDSQELNEELLNDVSFVALDMPEFLIPNTAWLRLSNVIGRILILSSDYIQSDQISPEEWVLHASMLAVSTHMFLCCAGPLMSAIFSITALSVRDRRAYIMLFEAVGLSVLQFKTLLSSKTLDWVEHAPNEVVELNGENMYFRYSGEAAIPAATATGNNTGKNKNNSNVDAAKSIDNSDHIIFDGEALHVSNMVFGDVQFAKVLETFIYENAKKKSKSTKKKNASTATTKCSNNSDATNIANNPTSSVGSSFIVGPNGASMMRISTSKLLRLMKNDNELSSSVQLLVLQCMHKKLSRSL